MIKRLLIILLFTNIVLADNTCPKVGLNVNDRCQFNGLRKYWNGKTWVNESITQEVSPFEYSPLQTQVGLQTAITAIGSNPTIMNIDRIYTISGNISIPSNVTLKFRASGRFDIATGVTVTIAGGVESDLTQRFVLSGTGKASFTDKAQVKADWWGYSTTDGDINRVAIQSAINSLTSGSVLLSRQYIVKSDNALLRTDFPIIELKNGIDIIGISNKQSILKVIDNNGQYLSILGSRGGNYANNINYNVSNVTVERITFDHNYANNTSNSVNSVAFFTTVRGSLVIYGGGNIVFRDNVSKDSDSIVEVYLTPGFFGTAGKDFENGLIQGNRFENTGDIVDHYDHSAINVGGHGMRVTNNFFKESWTAKNAGSAIEIHAHDCIVSGNVMEGHYAGVNVTGINSYADDEDIIVTNNTIKARIRGINVDTRTQTGHMSGYALNRLIISNNTMKIDYNQGVSSLVGLYPVAGILHFFTPTLDIKNILFENNNIEFVTETVVPTQLLGAACGGMAFSGGGTNSFRENLVIRNNLIVNSPFSGINFNVTKMKNVLVEQNTIINPSSGTSTGGIGIDGKSAIRLSSIYNANGAVVLIKDNTIVDTRDTSLIPYQYYYSESDTSTTGVVEFINNKLYLNGSNITSFQSPFYPTADNTMLPLWIEDTEHLILPTFYVKKGSRAFDITNAREWYNYFNTNVWTKTTAYNNELLDTGASQTAWSFNYTTNKAGGDDTGILLNWTDTASPGVSRFVDFKQNNITNFQVQGNGDTYARLYYTTLGYLRAGAGVTLNLNDVTQSSALTDVRIAPTYTNVSGDSNIMALVPTYNQASGTGKNTDFLINRTETAVMSGAQLLIDAQVGSVSKFAVTTAGEAKISGISGDGNGKAVCIKSDGNLGTCTDSVGAGGTCTCN